MNYILFDGTVRNALLPFTFTRPVADIRIGILTIREKWEKYLGYTTTTLTEEYLMEKYPMVEMEQNVMINASFLPNPILIDMVQNLNPKEAILFGEEIIAFHTNDTQEDIDFDEYELIEYEGDVLRIENTWDIFAKNDAAIREDFELLTEDRFSQPIPKSVNVIAPENIFIEEGAKLEFVTLNASTGPIYIGKNAEIMEGSVVRGSLALCEGSKINMGSKIYGATTIGPHSKVGGEVNNIVITGFTNKGHEGFVGNSVIGEWCNLGADTNSSNLKNNYAEVKLWSYPSKKFVKTGLQFCGLIMGDHSKTAINTQFNTGTVVGVGANIFKSGFPPNLIEHFSWGGFKGDEKFRLETAYEVAEKAMARRKMPLTEEDKEILKWIYENC